MPEQQDTDDSNPPDWLLKGGLAGAGLLVVLEVVQHV